MKKMSSFAGLVFFAFYVISCSGSGGDKLAGMYKLFIIENLDSATMIWHTDPWYDGGESYIIYDGLGHMAV